MEAATQIFYSSGVGAGVLISLASYSKLHYNTLKDTMIITLTNSFTSIFSSIVVFSVVGFLAEKTDTDPKLVR